MGEHLLTDRLTFSAACRDNKLHILSNRVQRRVRQAQTVRAFTLWQIEFQLRVQN